MTRRSRRVSVMELENLVSTALQNGGLQPENVQPVAASIVACERDGVKGHGLLRLPGFVHSLRTGWADGASRPAIVAQAPSSLTVDALNGFAQVALASVRDRIRETAQRTGSALLLTRNSHHFSAIWPDIEPFAADGFVALSCVNSKKRMAAWGGGRPVTGTNAIGFAAPRAGREPLVWDQSTSVLSQGDVLHAAREGREVALGVGCDAAGRPTSSPEAILDGGALLPFGGAKGASLAVMVEILAAALTGGPFGFEDRSPSGTGTTSLGGQFLLVIDPARSVDDFHHRMTDLCAALAEAGSTRLPGDRRYEFRRQAIAGGIELDERAYDDLREMAQEA